MPLFHTKRLRVLNLLTQIISLRLNVAISSTLIEDWVPSDVQLDSCEIP